MPKTRDEFLARRGMGTIVVKQYCLKGLDKILIAALVFISFLTGRHSSNSHFLRLVEVYA